MEIRGSNEISIHASRDRIWHALADSTCLPEWATMVKHTTGHREAVGSTRTCRVEWEGRQDEVVERCTEAIPNERIGWVMERGMMLKMFSKVAFGFVLKPESSGSTRVRMEYSYRPRNVFTGLLFRVMMARKMDTMRRGLLGNLKQFVERGHPSFARASEGRGRA